MWEKGKLSTWSQARNWLFIHFLLFPRVGQTDTRGELPHTSPLLSLTPTTNHTSPLLSLTTNNHTFPPLSLTPASFIVLDTSLVLEHIFHFLCERGRYRRNEAQALVNQHRLLAHSRVPVLLIQKPDLVRESGVFCFCE